jgi:hypothetical protein
LGQRPNNVWWNSLLVAVNAAGSRASMLERMLQFSLRARRMSALVMNATANPVAAASSTARVCTVSG